MKPTKQTGRSFYIYFGATCALNFLLVLGCGVKGPPLPPIDTTPQATETSETLLLKKNAASQSSNQPKVKPSGQPVQQSTGQLPGQNPLQDKDPSSPKPTPSNDPQSDDR